MNASRDKAFNRIRTTMMESGGCRNSSWVLGVVNVGEFGMDRRAVDESKTIAVGENCGAALI